MANANEHVDSEMGSVAEAPENITEERIIQSTNHHHDEEQSVENILDFETGALIKPYRFEPTPRQNCEQPREETESESESEVEVDEINAWCACNNCTAMASDIENKCCHSYVAIRNILDHNKSSCIIDHEGFFGNCLNPYVLEASVYEFVKENGPLGDDEPVNELMRYLAYRRFVRWVFGKLGTKNRRIIPACAVNAIRQRYPSNFFHGFRYPIY